MIKNIEFYNSLLEEYRLSVINQYRQKCFFRKLKVYDVVWCKMPLTDEEKKIIPISHQRRPYVILEKTDKNIIGYACTSKDKPSSIERILISKEKSPCTFIRSFELFEVPSDNIKRKMFCLDKSDINEIIRRNNILKNKISDIELSIGDLIYDFKTGLTYYIYALDQDNVLGLNVVKQEGDFIIAGKQYKANYSNIKEFNKRGPYNIIKISTSEEKLNIMNIMNVKKYINELKNIEIGQIVAFDNKLYYIYAADNVNSYGFLVSKEKLIDKEQVQINKFNYYYDIQQLVKFESKCLYNVVDKATSSQIVEIEKTKNSKKRLLKEQQKQKLLSLRNTLTDIDLRKGTILEFEGEEYVYLYMDGEKYCCANLLMYRCIPEIAKLTNVSITSRRVDVSEYENILSYLAETDKNKRNMYKMLYEQRKNKSAYA